MKERKLLFSQTRKKISEDEWYDYLEKCYPEWWKSIYGNKWRINIIYYSDKDESPTTYSLYINKTNTMQQIMNNFSKMLKYQRTAVQMCFGSDIAENILNYFPNNEFSMTNNYIYVHQRIFNIDGTIDFTRYCVPNDKTLVRLCGFLCEQDTTHLNLRIRRTPLNKKGCNFSRIYYY